MDEQVEILSDFERGDEVMVTLNIEPFHFSGAIEGYSEFMPGIFFQVMGQIEEVEPVSDLERLAILRTVEELDTRELLEAHPDSDEFIERIEWVVSYADHNGLEPDFEFVWDFYERRDIIHDVVEYRIACIDMDRKDTVKYREFKRPIRTFMNMKYIVKMETLSDALDELDISDFADGLDDMLKTITSEVEVQESDE